MVSKCGHALGERKVENGECALHIPQQMLSNIWLPPHQNRQNHRLCYRLWDDVIARLFFILPSDMILQRRRGENKFHHTLWHMLLSVNARRHAEHWPNILQNDEGCAQRSSGQKHIHICWWYCSYQRKEKSIHLRSDRKTTNMHEACLKLNPDKFVFGVTRVKVLGCLVSLKSVTKPPQKWGICLHKIDHGILVEVRMRKYT
jgi:hypothetical protein